MDWKQRFLYRPHLAITAVVLLASLAFLWHAAQSGGSYADPLAGSLLEGRVVKIISEDDAPVGAGSRTGRVQNLLVRLEGDTGAGREVMVYNDLALLEPGDGLYVGASRYGTPEESFSIMDYRRAPGLAWLVVAFAVLVVGVSGRKGLDALAGMAFTGAIIFGYTVPTLLGRGDAFTVGLLSAGIIVLGTFYLSYGFNRKSLAALAGIGVTLLLTGVLGRWAVGALRFTGYADESAMYLNHVTGGLDIVGLVVAGIIIATVGVLDDVAVTQASTVMELAHAGTARGWELFRRAMRVGNDHISAVINTLLLAYAGAALPLLLLLRTADFPFGFAIGGELVAEEIVRTIVSSMGLVLAVPLTTLIAVAVVHRWGPGEESLGHTHRH
jgi:uncharacterized membrane protein